MPRELGLYYISKPDSKLAWFKFQLRDEKGAVARCTDVLAKRGADLIFGYFEVMERGRTGKYIAFAELKKEADLNNLVKNLKSLDVVLDLEYHTAKKVIFQTAEFPLTLLGSRAFIARSETFVEMMKTIEESSHRPSELIFLSGLKSGMNTARHFSEKIGLTRENAIEILIGLLFAAGWGKLYVDLDLDSLSGYITVKDSFIADAYGAAASPKCNWLSGFLSGFFTVIFKEEIFVKEIKCKAVKGDACVHRMMRARDKEAEGRF
ncbi:MAG: V4R domain-containing protein [Methanocellales archaeon]